MWSEFNANNFTEHEKIPLNKNTICGNRREKGIQSKPQEISSIKSKWNFQLLPIKSGISILYGKNASHSILTMSTSIFKTTLSVRVCYMSNFRELFPFFYIILVTAFIKIV